MSRRNKRETDSSGAARRVSRKSPAAGAEPHLALFWLTDAGLVFDQTPLSQAERYSATHLIHPGDHIHVWARLQREGKVPTDVEYEQPPRGRVVYETATKMFVVLADRCILSRPELVTEIRQALHLPPHTRTETDAHYRCFSCLYGKPDQEEDDDNV